MITFSFTALCRQSGRFAGKIVTRRADGSIKTDDYPEKIPGERWAFRQFECGSHRQLAHRLLEAADEPSQLFVAGTPAPHLDLNKPHPRYYRASLPENERNLVDVPRSCMVVDVDKADVTGTLSRPERIVDAAKFLRDEKLPPEFRGVRCVVSPSATTGLRPGKSSLRLWFLLGSAMTLSTLAAWAARAQRAGFPIDPAMLRPGGLIYTTRPRFVGLGDPIAPEHCAFVLRGDADTVTLAPISLPREQPQKQRVYASSLGELNGQPWRTFLERNFTGDDGGCYTPLKTALGGAVADGESEEAVVGFCEQLIDERGTSEKRRRYDRRWLTDAYRSFARGTEMQGTNLAAARRDLFRDLGWRIP